MNREITLTLCLFWMTSATTSHNNQHKISSSNRTQSPLINQNHHEKQVQPFIIPKKSQQNRYNLQSRNQKVAFVPTNTQQYELQPYSNVALSQASEQYINVEQLPQPIIAYDHHPNVKQYSSPLQPQFQLTAHQQERLQRLISPEKYSSPHGFNPGGLPFVPPGGTNQNFNSEPYVDHNHGYVNSQPLQIQGNPFLQYQVGVQSPTLDSAAAQQNIIDPASILIHTTKQLKNIDPQYFQPQVFYDPVVPQHQLYLPKIFKTPKIIETPYERHVESHYTAEGSSKNKKKRKESTEDSTQDENGKTQDKDSFEKGYHKAAYDFPAYNQDDNEDGINSAAFKSESYGSPKIESEYNSASHEDEASSEENEPDKTKEKRNEYARYSDKDNYYNDQKKFNPASYF